MRVVTGAGKTYLGLHLARHVRLKHPRARILIVVPTLALMDQWHVSVVEDLGVSEDDIACYAGGYKADTKPRVVNISVVNTARVIARRWMTSDIDGWMLIADECHRYGSPVNKSVLELPYRWTLGLSATPEREFDTGFEEHLLPRLGDVIFDYNYDSARRDGVISPFALWNFRIPLLAKEREAYDHLTKRIGALYKTIVVESRKNNRPVPSIKDVIVTGDHRLASPIRSLLLRRRSVSINANFRLPSAARIAMDFRTHQILMFHERISAAESLHKLLLKTGLRSTIYHSKVSPVQRSLNLLMFRRGAAGVLVTCRALDEGLDVPEAEVGVVVASTRSTRQRIQRMGRVLRKASGKDHAIVCTIYSTDAEEEDLRNEAAKLSDVAEIKWFQVGNPKGGS